MGKQINPMQASVGGKASEAEGERPRKQPHLPSMLLARAKTLMAPVLIFALAFFLRFLYNCVFMEHRIAHFGDAYNFLRSGSCLLEAAASSHNLTEFIGKVYHASAPQAQLLQSMTSLKLTDRLLIDGPIFPAYLALIEWLSGVNAFKPIFDAYSVQLCLCNSFVDAITCSLVYTAGRLAFNRKAALVAGLLFAFYPAAIINTQHCYSEPFSYFLLMLWTVLTLRVLLRHVKDNLSTAASWCGIGVSTGLLMLSKPAFILLAPMAIAAIVPISLIRQISLKNKDKSNGGNLLQLIRKFATNAALAAVGLAIILTPWVLFNKSVTGQYSVFVNRVPSFNIFHGNQLKTDAWRCYPFYGTFPGDSKLVVASLLEDAKQAPVPFLGLQFKKVARLWSGEWNEYHYSLFGIPLQIQNLFHQLLLTTGTAALAYLLMKSRKKTLSRGFSASVLLGTIVLFHFAYIPFEAISRYAITAMPAIILLCAALITDAWAVSAARRTLLLLTATSIAALLFLSASGTIANLLASILPSNLLEAAPCISVAADCAWLFAIFWLVAKLLNNLLQDKSSLRFSLIIPAALALLTCIVAGFYTIQSFDWREWQCSVSPKQSVVQKIVLPGQVPDASTAFILIDMGATTLAPPISVKLNGETLNEKPTTLAQFQPNNTDILQCLAIQGEGMSMDLRSYRNWWVIPVSSSSLKAGAENTIEISCADGNAHVLVYGDYHKPALESSRDGKRFLPSLRSFSYTKGFTTFDHRDPRVFEELSLEGKTSYSARQEPNAQAESADLSDSFGKQFGSYRIHILIPSKEHADNAVAQSATDAPESSAVAALPKELSSNPNDASKAITLVGDEAQLVAGGNPASFVPGKAAIPLPSNLPAGTRIYFTCETRSVTGHHSCFINLTFSGTDENGEAKTWTSKWQPIGIPASKNFRETSFVDMIPDNILKLHNLEIRPMFSPFLPDYLFLKRKQALKNSIEVQHARIMLLQPLNVPPMENTSWTVY